MEDEEEYKSVSEDFDEPMDGDRQSTVELWSGRNEMERDSFRRKERASTGGSDTMDDSENDRKILLNMKKKVNGDYQRTNTMDTEDDDTFVPGKDVKSMKYDYHYPQLIGGSGSKSSKEHEQLVHASRSEEQRMNIIRKSSETSVAWNASTDEETQNSSVQLSDNLPYIYPTSTD